MKRYFLIVVLVAVISFGGCGSNGGAVKRQQADTAMGTVIYQTLYCAREEDAKEISAEIRELLRALEEERISWRLETSEVYKVNAAAGSVEGCLLSEDMELLLCRCLEFSKKSGGAFDFTIGSVARLWKIDDWADGMQEGEFVLPSQEALRKALNACGSEKLTFVREADNADGQEGQMRIFLPEDMQIDLGAAGKGLALSEIAELLEGEKRLQGAVISVGGSILTFGSKPDGSDWKVGIVNPFDTASYVGFLSLKGRWCVSTSGDYERYVELDGIRYHHILDPDTGFPADSGVRGVTVLTKDGLAGDVISTACFILGPEAGMALAEEYGAETLFVMADGEIVMSEGMKESFSED